MMVGQHGGLAGSLKAPAAKHKLLVVVILTSVFSVSPPAGPPDKSSRHRRLTLLDEFIPNTLPGAIPNILPNMIQCQTW